MPSGGVLRNIGKNAAREMGGVPCAQAKENALGC